jgi:hypothetical protein
MTPPPHIPGRGGRRTAGVGQIGVVRTVIAVGSGGAPLFLNIYMVCGQPCRGRGRGCERCGRGRVGRGHVGQRGGGNRTTSRRRHCSVRARMPLLVGGDQRLQILRGSVGHACAAVSLPTPVIAHGKDVRGCGRRYCRRRRRQRSRTGLWPRETGGLLHPHDRHTVARIPQVRGPGPHACAQKPRQAAPTCRRGPSRTAGCTPAREACGRRLPHPQVLPLSPQPGSGGNDCAG